MRTQLVDCRWELSAPARGRELYLAGHVPGASFLDVDADLSDLSVPDAGRHPLPSAEKFATAAAVTASILAGAHIVRVHDVAEMRAVVQVADEILKAGSAE